MWILYNVLLILLAPLWLPWMGWRSLKRGEKPDWRERRGDYRESLPEKGERPRLWVHAVSVGEVVAAQPLLRALRERLPRHEIVLSVTTSSGHRTATEIKDPPHDHLVYLPIDLPPFTLAAMRRVRPDALIVMETELWMNLFWAARRFGAKLFVANGRLSDRSFPRARRLGAFYRMLLRGVTILAQSATDGERFRALGADRVIDAGNVKFDGAIEGLEETTDWREELGLDERPVVVVGSLRAEEFDLFAKLFAALGEVEWVVAPRHIERTGEFLRALAGAGEGGMTVGRRSERTHGEVTVLDTYGELARVYSIADVAVVGGSFEKLGGQNILQPLAWGKPVLHGPHMANFRDVASLAERAGATVVCADGESLLEEIMALIAHPEERERRGSAARALVEANRGASARMAEAVASTLEA